MFHVVVVVVRGGGVCVVSSNVLNGRENQLD